MKRKKKENVLQQLPALSSEARDRGEVIETKNLVHRKIGKEHDSNCQGHTIYTFFCERVL